MRLTKISTRTGDAGETGIADGSRVGKDSLRICALGDVDELNSSIGLILSEPLPEDVELGLEAIQHDLFELGAELCQPGQFRIGERQVSGLEDSLEKANATLDPLAEFILPGGTRAAALCHMARTVCRRAERTLVELSKSETVGMAALKYLNRLSDLLFVYARMVNRAQGCPDKCWKPEKG